MLSLFLKMKPQSYGMISNFLLNLETNLKKGTPQYKASFLMKKRIFAFTLNPILHPIAMKKITFLSILLCVTMPAFAQETKKSPISWGIRAGTNVSYRTKYAYHDPRGSGTAELLGVYIQWQKQPQSHFKYQLEVLYKTFSVGVKITNLELPLSVKYFPSETFNIFIGGAPVLPLVSVDDNGDRITKFKNPVNLSYFLGIGGQIPFGKNALGLDFRYCGYAFDNYVFTTGSLGGCCFNVSNKAATFDFSITYHFK
jgi:hypothetical protein